MADKPGSGGGLKIRPMAQIAEMITRMSNRLYEAPQDVIEGIDSNAWPSPLQPVRPFGSADSEPFGWQFQFGQNLIFTPRADAEYSASELREWAQYDLVRVIIENVKDICCSTNFSVQLKPQPGETKKQARVRGQGDQLLLKLNKFFDWPNAEQNWEEFLRELLEDMLVIDAASILMRKTHDGTIAELRAIDGSSIIRYIDQFGYTPMPPSPAYAQVWYGAPLVNLTTDQLIYKPRNIVKRATTASYLYGMSPLEQALGWIRAGSSRLQMQQLYYTQGSIPDMIQVVPPTASPDKLAESMKWNNSELAGNLAKRQQMRIIQGFSSEGKDQILFPKEKVLTDPFEDMLIRYLCFAFGTSPQRLLHVINRATAEANQQAANIEGSLPFLTWVKNVRDFIVQRKMGFMDYESSFDPGQETDAEKRANVAKIYVAAGILTINEVRDDLGEEPRPEPEANMLGTQQGIWTAISPEDRPIVTPPAGLGSASGDDSNSDGGKNGNSSTANGTRSNSSSKEKPGKPAGGSKPATSGGKRKGASSGFESPAASTAKLCCARHGSFEPYCLDCCGAEAEGKRARLDGQSGSPEKIVTEKNLITATALVAMAPQPHNPPVPPKVPKHVKILARFQVGGLSGEAGHAKGRMNASLARVFAAAQQKVFAVIDKKVKDSPPVKEGALPLRGIKKDNSEDELIRAISDAIATEYNLIPDLVREDLEAAIKSGLSEGFAQLNATSTDMITAANETAAAWARRRAAELVGMRQLQDGTLVENPNAEWAISDTTRDEIRRLVTAAFETDQISKDDLKQSIQDAGTFSESRADMIAKTEISRAESIGNFDSWTDSGLVKKVMWFVSDDEGICDDCEENDEVVVKLGDAFPSGDTFPPAHPNCRCMIAAVEISEGE